MPPSWPSRTPQGSRPSATLKGGKLNSNNNSVNKDRALDWEVRCNNNHCDTIAYSATGRVHPSTREARGTGGGRSSSRGTSTTPLHTTPKFLPEQGREAGRTRCGGEESELVHMIEKIYYIKKTNALTPGMRLRQKHLMYSTK
jgi:hypothetical protein